jgi:MarR family transcriptional regulator for hemolysin
LDALSGDKRASLGTIQREYRDPRFRLTLQIVLAARRWRSLLEDRLRPRGHSAPRMEVMSSISHGSRLSAQIEIAKRIGIEGPTLTRMLDMMEAEKLVERLPDPADRRAKLIRLTEQGQDSLAEAGAVAASLREQLLCEFSEEELEQINRFFERFLQRIRDLPAES